MALLTAGFSLLGTFGAKSLLLCVLGGICLESGNAFVMMPAITAANNALPKDLMSHGTALITTMRQVIGAASVVVASSLITVLANSRPYHQALAQTSLWLLLLPLIGIGLGAFLQTKKAA